MTIFAGTDGRKGWEESNRWWRDVREALQQLPGVDGVTTSFMPPIQPSTGRIFWIERPGGQAEPVLTLGDFVGADYFRQLGIPLIEGRHFDDRDQRDSPRVSIVSAEAARRFWPGESALGKTIRIASSRMTVVGVVGDVRAGGLWQGPQPFVYAAQSQVDFAAKYWMVRSSREPESLFPEIVKSLQAIDPAVKIQEPGYQVLDDVVWDSTWELNYSMILLAALAGLALFISAVGVYGVLSYAVRQRTREIGLRVALGAERPQILKMVLWQGLSIAATGVVLGLVAAAGLARFLGSLLYGVEPLDAPTFVSVAVVLLAAATLASYIPARRAASVDPLVALRHE